MTLSLSLGSSRAIAITLVTSANRRAARLLRGPAIGAEALQTVCGTGGSVGSILQLCWISSAKLITGAKDEG